MSEPNPSYEVEGIVSRQDCVEAHVLEGNQNISATLNVPKNTVASIILTWMKFGTNNTLPRDGCPAKLSNREKRSMVREVTKNPMVTLTEL